MNVGIIGSGAVAQALATGFLAHGHAVMLGTRTPAKLADWGKAHPIGRIGGTSDAAGFGALLVLAVKGTAALEALRGAEAAQLAGKTIMDATNPIADAPPVHGVLRYFTTFDDSLMERLQLEFPAAHFVKAFNSVGSALMVNPRLTGGPPTMFICGNDMAAKAEVVGILKQFGWDASDLGHVEAARAIEPLAMLWCIPGFLRNDWAHAFKMLS
jgi:8-hydroxy-5-deazaflavin:NADPH oxidoreductase